MMFHRKLTRASSPVLLPFCSDPAIGKLIRASFLPWLSRCSSILFPIYVAVAALRPLTLLHPSYSRLVKVVRDGFRAGIFLSYSLEERFHNVPKKSQFSTCKARMEFEQTASMDSVIKLGKLKKNLDLSKTPNVVCSF